MVFAHLKKKIERCKKDSLTYTSNRRTKQKKTNKKKLEKHFEDSAGTQIRETSKSVVMEQKDLPRTEIELFLFVLPWLTKRWTKRYNNNYILIFNNKIFNYFYGYFFGLFSFSGDFYN